MNKNIFAVFSSKTVLENLLYQENYMVFSENKGQGQFNRGFICAVSDVFIDQLPSKKFKCTMFYIV